MKKLILLTVVFVLHIPALSQVGIGTENPDPSALLELNVNSENNKKGFLPPRVTETERNDIPSPAEGLVVYNTTENCINFYNGTGWVNICDGSITYPPPPPLNDRLGGSGSDSNSRTVQQTADGGFIMAATSDSSASGDISGVNHGAYDLWILKLDAAGNKTWDKLLGGGGSEFLGLIQQTADGGYIVTGYSDSSDSGDVSGANHGGTDYWIVKLDASGNKIWDKLLGGNGNDSPFSIQQTSDGGYVVAGESVSTSANTGDQAGTAGKGGTDYWVVKLDAAGAIQWQKRLGGSSNERANSVQQTSDGGYILAGYSSSSATGDVTGTSNGNVDYWVVKLDSSGNKTWDKILGGNSSDLARSIRQTTDGGYIIAGYSSSSATGDVTDTSNGSDDYWIVKLDSSGNKTWDKLLGGNNTDQVYSIRQTTDGGYIMAGYSLSSATGDVTDTGNGSDDYWIVKLDSSGNIIWDKLLGGSGIDRGYCVEQTLDGSYVIIGESRAESAGNGDQAGLTGRGNLDIWVVRLDENGDIIQ